jgi:hypothetical protein
MEPFHCRTSGDGRLRMQQRRDYVTREMLPKVTPQRPRQTGLRFSENAFTPSWKSSLP